MKKFKFDLNVNTRIRLWGYGLSLEFGWFPGNQDFKVLKLAVGEVHEDYPSGWSAVYLISIQIAYLHLDIGVHNKEND